VLILYRPAICRTDAPLDRIADIACRRIADFCRKFMSLYRTAENACQYLFLQLRNKTLDKRFWDDALSITASTDARWVRPSPQWQGEADRKPDSSRGAGGSPAPIGDQHASHDTNYQPGIPLRAGIKH